MSTHKLADEFLEAGVTRAFQQSDPGNAGTISPTKSPCYIELVTGGAETRTLADPTGPMQFLVLTLVDDGGDCVITYANLFNTTGNNTATYADAGDYQLLVSVQDGSAVGTYHWREVSNDGAGLSTV